MRNLQDQIKKAFCYQNLFWLFTVWIICSNDLKNFANTRPSASNFKSFSRSPRTIFSHTIGQNNFGNKIPLISCVETKLACEHCKLFSPEPWKICYKIYIQYLSFVIINLILVRLLKDFFIYGRNCCQFFFGDLPTWGGILGPKLYPGGGFLDHDFS